MTSIARRRRGFTLLELVVATVLTSILMLMTLSWVGTLGKIAATGSGADAARAANVTSVRFAEDVENADSCDRLRRDGPVAFMSNTALELFRDAGSTSDPTTPDGNADLVRWELHDSDPSADGQTLQLTRSVTYGGGTCTFTGPANETTVIIPAVRPGTTTVFSPVADGDTIAIGDAGVQCRTTYDGVQDPVAWQTCAWDGIRLRVVLDGGDGTTNLLDFFTPLNLSGRRTPDAAGTQRTAPGAPTIGAATAGNASATVSFGPPATTGGSAITGYTVTSSPGGITASGTGSPITVTGLTNATTYTFTVTASNAIGTSAPSAASAPVTPDGSAPHAPTIGTVSAGNRQVTVSFNAPTPPVAAPVVDYTVTSSPGGITATGTGSPITVTGLTNGTTYTFSVTARNSIGTGAASAPSATATPFTVPDAPTIGAPSASNTTTSVTFTAPTFNGGLAITGYQVTSNPGGITATGTSSPITVTGLTNGTTYTFTVQAQNAAGYGTASAPSAQVTPSGPANAPTSITATAGNASATVSFGPPTFNGGSAITGYQVTSNPGGITATGTSSPITVTGLTNGTTYTFTVQAQNGAGNGASSTPSNAVTPYTVPGAPAVGTATAAVGSATVTFTPPSTDGGAAVTGYKVTSNPGGITATGASSPITVSGLTNGTAYTFTVQAQNAAGFGSASAASNSVTPGGVPGAPTGVTASPLSGAASITFVAPAANGSPISKYTVTASPGGGTKIGFGSPIFISGLTNGTAYTFTVTATNGFGTGPASAPSAPVYPGTAPGAMLVPFGVSINGSTGAVSMNFNAPSNGGSPITSYVVQTYGAATVSRTCAGLTSPCTFSVPTVGDYQFKIAAVNAIGTGTYSGFTALNGYCSATPTAPTLTSLVNRSDINGGAFTVGWSASSGGGCSITTYELNYSGIAATYTSPTSSACITNTWSYSSLSVPVKVRAQNSAGVWGPYSAVQNVSVAARGTTGDISYCGVAYP